MSTRKSHPTAGKAGREPTSQERSAIENYLARKAASPAPRLKVSDKNVWKVPPDHPNEAIGSLLLMEAFGTADENFLNGLLAQIANLTTTGHEIDEHGLNFIVSPVWH